MFRRVLSLLGANAFSQVMNVSLRLISIPLLLQYWGKERYGEWLILLTIPTFLAIGGSGFSSVASNEMSIWTAKKNEHKAQEVLQSSWLLVLIAGLLLILISFSLGWFLPFGNWFGITHTNLSELRPVLILLGIYTVLLLHSELLVGVYRAAGYFGRGVFLNSLISICENLSVIIIAAFSKSLFYASLAFVLTRAIGLIFLGLWIRKKASWFKLGFENACYSQIRSTAGPTFSMVGIQASNAILSQGTISVIGITMGSVAVVSFNVVRTLVNLIRQMNGMVYYSLCPEFSIALAVQNKTLATRLHRIACEASLLFCLITVTVLIVFGNPIFDLWIRDKVFIDPVFFILMMLAVLPNALYVTSSYVQVSINRVSRISILCLISSVLFLVFSLLFLPISGLWIVPLLYLITDSILLILILPESLKLVGDSRSGFLISLLKVKEFRKMLLNRWKSKSFSIPQQI